MEIINNIKEKAKALNKRVVLPEGPEERTILAAGKIIEEGICKVTLLGDVEKIKQMCEKESVPVDKIEIIDPVASDKLDDYAQEFYGLRKRKGISEADARETMKNVLYYGAMMVRKGDADGCVAGAHNTTGDVMRAAIQTIGMAEGIKTVSSCFIMVIPEFLDEKDKILIFGDCAVLPDPNVEQLASIAVSSAKTMKSLVGEEPKVAMLSFSTMGSASHEMVDKVVQAMQTARQIDPDLKIDGELQVDAAIIPNVGKRKAPDSVIAGQANVLVFPDLNAGNIGYKLVQRLAGAEAIGPIIQGLAKPMNDLSRGCSVDDIVNVSAIAILLS
ncbi:MAG: phosphate acetyltransferase [candidate division Zixibacteria bacterium]|nr:phosphate acetyltransferase [candidate division Zixibacteria bacterium]